MADLNANNVASSTAVSVRSGTLTTQAVTFSGASFEVNYSLFQVFERVEVTGASGTFNNCIFLGVFDAQESVTANNCIFLGPMHVGSGKTLTLNNCLSPNAEPSVSGTITDTNCLWSTDPGFIPDTYRPDDGSPLYDAGVDVDLTEDYAGETVLDGVVNIGLYENIGLNATDVSSSISIGSPVLFSSEVMSGNDVASFTEVSAANITTVWHLGAADVTCETEADGELHPVISLGADDVSCDTEVNGALHAVYGLFANDVSSEATVREPLFGTEISLAPNNVRSVSQITAPGIAPARYLGAGNVSSCSSVSGYYLAPKHDLDPAGVECLTQIASQAITPRRDISPNDVESLSSLGVPSFSKFAFLAPQNVSVVTVIANNLDVDAEDVSSSTSVCNQSLTFYTIGLIADDVESASSAEGFSLVAVRPLSAGDISSLTRVTTPPFMHRTDLSAENVTTLTTIENMTLLNWSALSLLRNMINPTLADSTPAFTLEDSTPVWEMEAV